MTLPTTSKRPLYIFAVLLLLIVALISSLKASGHPTRFLKLSSLSTSHPVNSSLWSMTPPHFPSPKSATIVILVNPGSNHYQVLIPTLQNLEEKFNRRLGYPIQLLTDGQLPDEKVRNRTEWITGGKARWCKFIFAILREIHQANSLSECYLSIPRSSCDARTRLGSTIMDYTGYHRYFDQKHGIQYRLSVRFSPFTLSSAT